jgi:hypothetical protein
VKIIQKIEHSRWLIKLVHVLWNPYRVDIPGGNCPVQGWGNLPTGEYYYFRSRHEAWRVEFCESEAAWDKNELLFAYGENDFCDPYEAGWISQLKAYLLLNSAIRQYYLWKTLQ